MLGTFVATCRHGLPVPLAADTHRRGLRIHEGILVLVGRWLDNRAMGSTTTTPDPDPIPQPPPQPDLDACCGNGCDPCIFDFHDLAMDEYRQALRAWRLRHPEAPPTA